MRRRSFIAAAGLLAAPAILRAEPVMRHRFPAGRQGALPSAFPTYPVAINRDHNIGARVLAFYMPGSLYGLNDIAGLGPPLTARTNSGRVVTAGGAANIGNGANPTGASSSVQPVGLEVNPVTVGWAGIITADHGGQEAMAFGISSTACGPCYVYGIAVDSGVGGVMRAEWNNAGSFSSAGFAAIPRNVFNAVAVQFPFGGGTGRCVANGAVLGSTYVATGNPNFAATDRVTMAAPAFDLTRIAFSQTVVGAIFQGALSQRDMAAWTMAPFSVLRPLTIDERFDAAGGGGGGARSVRVGD